MDDILLLIEKIPIHLRSSFIEEIKNRHSAQYNAQIVKRLLKNINRIDWNDYLIQYKDVAQKGYNPIFHYITTGWQQDRHLSVFPDEIAPVDADCKNVLSCKQLRNGLVYENGSLYPCCAVHNGQKPCLCKVNDDGTFDIDAMAAARRQIERELNTPGMTPVCSGCALLEELPEVPQNDVDSYYICKSFNLGESLHCNFRCIYCVFNQTHRCSEPPRITMAPIIKFLLKNNILARVAFVSIAGGEPLLMPDFGESLNLLIESGDKAITLNTNLSKWSEDLDQALPTGKILIRCSIDSGTPKTFARIKGRNLFWKIVENANRYAAISPDQVLLKYICIKENCNDLDLLGLLNILNISRSKLLIDFDYFTPPDKQILPFAARFKTLASVSGIDANARYEAEYNWNQPIGLRKKLDAYEILYLNDMYKLSGRKIVDSIAYKTAEYPIKGWIDNIKLDRSTGLTIEGWAWDHSLGAPKALRLYAGNKIICAGVTNYRRLDIEAGAKAGFSFHRAMNPVLKNILLKSLDLAVYASFDGLKWHKIPPTPACQAYMNGNFAGDNA